MFAGIWGILQGLNLTQKLISFGVIVGIFLAVYAAGLYKGYAWCDAKNQQKNVNQAINVGDHTVERAEALDRVAEKHDDHEKQLEQKESDVALEVGNYVRSPHTAITLDPEYQRLVDRINELQSANQNRLHAADSSSAGAEKLRTAQATTDQLLLAWLSLSSARARDLEVIEHWKEYDAVRYQKEMNWYLGLPPSARGEDE